MSDVGVGILRKGHIVVDFVDQYGDKRTIHKTKGTRLSVKRTGNTPVHALNRAAAILIGARIKVARIKAGLSLSDLAIRAGLAAGIGQHKMRMFEIESSTRNEGIRFGTLYAIALALDIPVSSLMADADDVQKASGVTFKFSEGLGV